MTIDLGGNCNIGDEGAKALPAARYGNTYLTSINLKPITNEIYGRKVNISVTCSAETLNQHKRK